MTPKKKPVAPIDTFEKPKLPKLDSDWVRFGPTGEQSANGVVTYPYPAVTHDQAVAAEKAAQPMLAIHATGNLITFNPGSVA